MTDWVQLVPIAALLLIFWFLVLRPARKRQAAFTALQESIAVGQRVMTTSGLYGEVTALTDETVDLRVAPEVVLTFARPAIAQVKDAEPSSSPDHKDLDAPNGD